MATTTKPRTALFVELDGVLIADLPHGAPGMALLPGVAAVVKRMNLAGVPVVVVTDHPARNGISEADFAGAVALLHGSMAESGALLTALYHCPTAAPHPWRKPRPGMLLAAARDHGLDLLTSWLVGRSLDDARAAAQAGCYGTVLVGAPVPSEDLGIVVAGADSLADALRSMAPRQGGCWHDHRSEA